MQDAARRLEEMLSAISERCWHAEWLVDTEYTLWQAEQCGAISWGQDAVTETDSAALKALSEEIGGWIVFEDELTFVPLPEWNALCADGLADQE